MTKDRKTLKEYSICIVILAGLTLVRLIVDACLTGFNPSSVNIEGASETLIKVSLIIAFVLALILLIPDVYVGIKGIKEATKPSGGKLHIILAKIICIINCLMTLVVVVALFKSDSIWNDISTLCSCLVDASIMFFYASECKKINKSLKK
jgi:uncharacterized membrane protein YhaH (DUF805 family)